MTNNQHLSRNLGLLGLSATGICSMLGASIYMVPFMIHRNVPGIGPYVLPAFMLAAIPAILAAIAYAILGSAMPRAGGSYIYASRGLHPYLGFIASFAQWFGLSIAIGVIAYVIVPFIRDIFNALDIRSVGNLLDTGWVRVSLALLLLWSFILVNLKGLKFYERILIPMMLIMFLLGAIVIVIGYSNSHEVFFSMATGLDEHIYMETTPFDWATFLSASAILISSFIGFDSIAQAGGEVKRPEKLIPRALLLTLFLVGTFYFLFTSAVYHTIPWQYVAEQARHQDITAPGLLRGLVATEWIVLIIAGAAVALINDLPAMLLSVSRLVYAWSKDRIFPQKLSYIHAKSHIPVNALLLSGAMASVGILGSHFAGDFFLGVDIMVTSMLVNFILMCAAVLVLPARNPSLVQRIQVVKSRLWQITFSLTGIMFLGTYLIMHIRKDLKADLDSWYFHSTPIWFIVMGLGSLIYFYNLSKLKQSGVQVSKQFMELP